MLRHTLRVGPHKHYQDRGVRCRGAQHVEGLVQSRSHGEAKRHDTYTGCYQRCRQAVVKHHQ